MSRERVNGASFIARDENTACDSFQSFQSCKAQLAVPPPKAALPELTLKTALVINRKERPGSRPPEKESKLEVGTGVMRIVRWRWHSHGRVANEGGYV